MDDAMAESVRRIIEANQKARGEFAERSSRLADALISGDREQFSETVNDILTDGDDETGSGEEDGQILGQDGET